MTVKVALYTGHNEAPLSEWMRDKVRVVGRANMDADEAEWAEGVRAALVLSDSNKLAEAGVEPGVWLVWVGDKFELCTDAGLRASYDTSSIPPEAFDASRYGS